MSGPWESEISHERQHPAPVGPEERQYQRTHDSLEILGRRSKGNYAYHPVRVVTFTHFVHHLFFTSCTPLKRGSPKPYARILFIFENTEGYLQRHFIWVSRWFLKCHEDTIYSLARNNKSWAQFIKEWKSLVSCSYIIQMLFKRNPSCLPIQMPWSVRQPEMLKKLSMANECCFNDRAVLGDYSTSQPPFEQLLTLNETITSHKHWVKSVLAPEVAFHVYFSWDGLLCGASEFILQPVVMACFLDKTLATPPIDS